MIGDGMGPMHVRAGEIQKGEPLHIQTIEQTTFSLTASADNAVTDSAAGGTAIATGVRTNNGYVGKGTDGKDLTTIMDLALEQGKRTGGVTTDILSGAIPMDFAGHSKNRNASAELLETAADSGINLFIANQQDSIGMFTDATGNVYTDVDEVENISDAQFDYVIGDYSIKASAESMSAGNSGVAFDKVVRESLEYLSQDPDGFVLMAEGAKIDKKSHDNDFSEMLAEMLAFDDAVKVAIDNGQLNTIEKVAGLRSNGMGMGKGAKKGEFVLGGEKVTLSYNAPNEWFAESVGAEVLGRCGDNVIYSRYQLGKGKVYMLGFPLEQLAHRDGLFNAEEPYYKIYSEFGTEALKEKIVRTEEKYIGITQHRQKDGSYIIIVINYTDGELDPKLQVVDGWSLTPVYGGENSIRGCDGAIFVATK